MLSQSTHDVAEWLLTTVETALDDCGRDPINLRYVAAGSIAWDDCCGMLVVAPERTYRSVTFPAPATDEELCFGGYLAIEFLVLLVRCIPTVDDRGRAPTQAQLQAAYTELLEDAAVVYNACVAPLPDYMVRSSVTQSFGGAEGGCISVETRFIIGLEQTEWTICCAEPQPHEPGDPICRLPADRVTFEPCGDLVSTNVQDAICEIAEAGGVPGPQGPEGPEGPQGEPGPPGPAPTTQTYAVSGGTTGTQPTFSGDPLFTAQYVRMGDFVHFEIQVDFDNIISFGTGQYFLTLPFPAVEGIMFRNGCLHDINTGREYHISGHAYAGSSDLMLFTTDVQGNRLYDFPFEQGEPITLTTADNFHIAGDYIATPLP